MSRSSPEDHPCVLEPWPGHREPGRHSRPSSARKSRNNGMSFGKLLNEYMAKFGDSPAVFGLPENLAIDLMKSAIKSGMPEPKEKHHGSSPEALT